MASTAVLLVLDETTFTARVCVGLMVPAADVKVPPLIEYSPPAILTGAAVSKPDRVIVPEMIAVLRAASVVAVKLNAAGVVSALLLELLVVATIELTTLLGTLLAKLLSALVLVLVAVLPPPSPPPPHAVSASAMVIKPRGRMFGLAIVMMGITPLVMVEELTKL